MRTPRVRRVLMIADGSISRRSSSCVATRHYASHSAPNLCVA